MKIVFVSNSEGSGDWEGMYVDGKLALEGHELKRYDILRILNIEYDSMHSFTDEEMGANLPEKIEDLPEPAYNRRI